MYTVHRNIKKKYKLESAHNNQKKVESESNRAINTTY
jgi:hypothetical protein